MVKQLMKKKNANIKWIKAHNGTYGNEIADYLAVNAKKSNIPFCNGKLTDDVELYKFNFLNSFILDHIKLNTNAKRFRNI
jgi:hypothetical protein